ncbi:hypothetical protein [Natronorubrum sp. FCH18a]|uniref:hypothetical protein n=1 Tax=Natronorubrum sp. FCH18a TaxID=3447018 RepID=UPI003F512C99
MTDGEIQLESEEPTPEEVHGIIESCRDDGNSYVECLFPPIGEGIGLFGMVADFLVGLGALAITLLLIVILLAAVAVAVYGTVVTMFLLLVTGIQLVADFRRAKAHLRECTEDVYWTVTWTLTGVAGLYVVFSIVGFVLAGLLGAFVLAVGAGDEELRAEFLSNLAETTAGHNPISLLQADAPNPGGLAFWLSVIGLLVFGTLHWYGTKRGLERPQKVPRLLKRGKTDA